LLDIDIEPIDHNPKGALASKKTTRDFRGDYRSLDSGASDVRCSNAIGGIVGALRLWVDWAERRQD